MSTSVVITGSTVNISKINNSNAGAMKTHDISPFIANNPNKEFVLNPEPVAASLIVTLDGLLLKPSADGNLGDYSYDSATYTLTLLVDNLESDAVLLAIYQEA